MFGGNGLPFSRHADVLDVKPSDDASLAPLVEELKRRGNAAFQQKSFEEAEVLYSRAIDINTSNPLKNQHIFFANRSASRCSMGKLEPAVEDAQACIDLEPEYPKGHFRKAQALNKLKRYKEALAALEVAKNLEPNNKSVATLYDQVKELSTKQVDAPKPTAPASTAKVTRVEVVKDSAKAAAPKPTENGTSAPEDVDMEEENITGAVRGYKKLADGRVTTYFNNELTEEAKKLIGDIAPKRVEDPNVVQIKNVEGGSAWNQGNTFEEKDMTSWGQSKISSLMDNLSIPVPNGTVTIEGVSDVSGDASIAVVRGSKRYIFDFAFTVKCQLLAEGESTPTEGQLKFLDMSSDCDGDYDVEVIVPSRYQSATGRALHELLSSSSSPVRSAFAAKLAGFVQDFHKF